MLKLVPTPDTIPDTTFAVGGPQTALWRYKTDPAVRVRIVARARVDAGGGRGDRPVWVTYRRVLSDGSEGPSTESSWARFERVFEPETA
jgi:hypothetical protein